MSIEIFNLTSSTPPQSSILPWVLGFATLAGIVATGVFSYLKYISDQASYNRSLLEDRYSIFDRLINLLKKCADYKNITLEDQAEAFDIYHRVLFLFSNELSETIDKIKHAVITLRTIKLSGDENPYSAEMKDHKEALDLIIHYSENNHLASLFSEMSVLNYYKSPKKKIIKPRYQNNTPEEKGKL